MLTSFPNVSGSRWSGLVPQWLVDSTNVRLAHEALTNLKAWAETHYSEYSTYAELEDFPPYRNCH